MKTKLTSLALGLWLTTFTVTAADALPSWNDTPPKEAIVAFVEEVTKAGSPDSMSVAERIATFDNDGTLWVEQPMYVQLRFALESRHALAPRLPDWKAKPPFSKLLSTPKAETAAVTEHELMEIIMVAHTGMTNEEFSQTVSDWIATAKHPETGQLYAELVYQPMLELLA